MAAILHVQLAWAALSLGRPPHHVPAVLTSVIYVKDEGGPNWAEIVTAVGSALAGLGVLGVLIGARSARDQLKATLTQIDITARQIEEAEKVRHISLAIEMARRWDDDALIAVRRSLEGLNAVDFEKKYKAAVAANSSDIYELRRLANFFEDFGVLEKLECLGIELIELSLKNSVIHYWEMYGPAVTEDRARWENLYENWEDLAEKLKARHH
jgi:hypothetical protein